MKRFHRFKTLLLLITVGGLQACTSGDPFFNVFVEIENNGSASSNTCTTACTVNVYPDLAKTSPVLVASATTPQACDGGFNLTNQTWQVGEFDLGQPNICAELGTNNPTEVYCEVIENDVVVHNYLASGEFPFVPQGCDRSTLDLTIFLNNLLSLSSDNLAGYSCNTLQLVFNDNHCDPNDNLNPVCAALNSLAGGGISTCVF